MKRPVTTDLLFHAPIYCAVALGIASSLTLSAAAADFTDANRISLNPSIPGADNPVNAAVVDNSGNLCIGGFFRVAGGVTANRIAKWNGSNWSALGSGLNGTVSALAVSGSDLNVGGGFTSAGGTAANGIAKWDGNNWTPLGSGLNGSVNALAALGNNLYAGGSTPATVASA